MAVSRFREVLRMSLIPLPEEWTRASFTLPAKLLAEVDVVRERVNAARQKPDRLSRDRLVQVLLEWAVKELARQEPAKPRARGGWRVA